MSDSVREQHPHELEHSWPAILFGLAIVACFVSLVPSLDYFRIVAGVLLIACVPACLARDWWIDRRYAGTCWSKRGHDD